MASIERRLLLTGLMAKLTVEPEGAREVPSVRPSRASLALNSCFITVQPFEEETGEHPDVRYSDGVGAGTLDVHTPQCENPIVDILDLAHDCDRAGRRGNGDGDNITLVTFRIEANQSQILDGPPHPKHIRESRIKINTIALLPLQRPAAISPEV